MAMAAARSLLSRTPTPRALRRCVGRDSGPGRAGRRASPCGSPHATRLVSGIGGRTASRRSAAAAAVATAAAAAAAKAAAAAAATAAAVAAAQRQQRRQHAPSFNTALYQTCGENWRCACAKADLKCGACRGTRRVPSGVPDSQSSRLLEWITCGSADGSGKNALPN